MEAMTRAMVAGSLDAIKDKISERERASMEACEEKSQQQGMNRQQRRAVAALERRNQKLERKIGKLEKQVK